MLPPSSYPRKRLLITLTLVSGFLPALVYGVFTLVENDSWVRGLIAVSALMLPPAFLAWLLLGEATRTTLGLVLTYAGFFILADGALGVLFWYGMAFVTAPLGKVGLPLVQAIVIAPYVVLGVAAARTTKELYGRPVVSESVPQVFSIVLLYSVAFWLASLFDFDFSQSERRSTSATESGARVGNAGDGMIDEIAHLRTCSLLLRFEHPEGVTASSIAELLAMYGRFSRADFSRYLCDWRRLRHSAHLEARDSLGTSMGYRVSYVGIRDSLGRIRDFEIVARPIAYGESGMRSYFVRSDGPIHVTRADRAATASDAVVPACEYGERAVACARMPSIRPPVVTLVHDSVATAGQPFTVAIRDATDPSRPADSTYEHHLKCTTGPGRWWLRPEDRYDVFQLGSALECKIPHDARTGPFADPVQIVVYTRDRSGAIGRAESVVGRVVPDDATPVVTRY